MPKLELTEKFCKSAKVEAGQRKTDYFDTIVTGFCFRVTVGGTKTFFFVYGRTPIGSGSSSASMVTSRLARRARWPRTNAATLSSLARIRSPRKRPMPPAKPSPT